MDQRCKAQTNVTFSTYWAAVFGVGNTTGTSNAGGWHLLMRKESEKEVIHRLEAFSDIVIGFSLAQLGLSLTIPGRVSDIFAPAHGLSTLGAFVMTFSLVCSLWWMHHRLFRHLFVPTPLNVWLNFAALGGVLFYAYVMQVLLHLSFRDPYAISLYLGCYAYIVVLFAYLAWYGLRTRGGELTQTERTEQSDFTVRLTILALGFSAFSAVTLISGSNRHVLEIGVVLVILPALIHRAVIRARKMRLAAANSPSA